MFFLACWQYISFLYVLSLKQCYTHTELPTGERSAVKLICQQTGCVHTHLFPSHICINREKHEIWYMVHHLY